MIWESLMVSIIPVILIVALFEAIMKGIALWKCGRNNQLARYVCLFIFNTAGILPLIYLIFFQKKKK